MWAGSTECGLPTPVEGSVGPTGSAPPQGWDGLAVYLARREILENTPNLNPQL